VCVGGWVRARILIYITVTFGSTLNYYSFSITFAEIQLVEDLMHD